MTYENSNEQENDKNNFLINQFIWSNTFFSKKSVSLYTFLLKSL